MKETIKSLNEELKDLSERVMNISKAIKSLQVICSHDYKPSGNDSDYDYEQCDICGIERKV